MLIKALVTTKTDIHTMIFYIYRLEDSQPKMIEDDFYIKWSAAKKVPKGVHHEIEIMLPDFSKHPHFSKIHLHKSKKNNDYFICYTDPVISARNALKILEMWAVGTMFTMETGIGFEQFLTEKQMKNLDYTSTLRKLSMEHNINVEIIFPEY